MSSSPRRWTRRFVRRSSRAAPVNSTRLATVLLGHGGQELAPAEHPLELVPPLVRAELLDPGVRRVAGDLLDAEVPVGAARDLRQVGDRDHLRAAGEPR